MDTGKEFLKAGNRVPHLHGCHHVPQAVGADDEEFVTGGKAVVGDFRPAQWCKGCSEQRAACSVQRAACSVLCALLTSQ